MNRSLVAFGLLGLLLACGKKTPDAAPDASPSAAPLASAAPDASVADAAVVVADASTADAGGHHVLVLRWQVAKATGAKLAVTLRAGSESIAVGELDATADGPESGTPKACSLKKTSSTESVFTCGGVPAYNFLSATLKGSELVVTRTNGVDGQNNSEKTKEVKRVPVTEGALRTLAFKPPVAAKAAKPKCAKGEIASDATGEWRCTTLCTADSDCKAGFFCDVQHEITKDGKIGAVLESGCEQDTK